MTKSKNLEEATRVAQEKLDALTPTERDGLRAALRLEPMAPMTSMQLTEADRIMLLSNSIERVCNTAMEVGGWTQNNAKDEHMQELGSTSWQDIEELKPLLCKLWNDAQERVRKGEL